MKYWYEANLHWIKNKRNQNHFLKGAHFQLNLTEIKMNMLTFLLCLTIGATIAFPQSSSSNSLTTSCFQKQLNTWTCLYDVEKDLPLDRTTCSDVHQKYECYREIFDSCLGDFSDSRTVFEQRFNSSFNILHPNNQCGNQELGIYYL